MTHEVSVIYQKEYSNGCVYVGRIRTTISVWDKYKKRPGGGIAIRYKWKPVQCKVLEDTSSLTLEEHCAREVYWINKKAKEYGIFPQVLYTNHSKEFVGKYRSNGLLLNTHDLDGSHINDEDRVKALKGRFRSFTAGDHERWHRQRINSREKYRLPDGFEGDYEECAKHIGISKITFRKWLRGTLDWEPRKLVNISRERVTTI